MAARVTATLQSGSAIGEFDQATGLTYGAPLVFTNDVVVPTSVDPTGVDETTDELQAFIDATPDGSRITFQPGGTYYCDFTVNLVGRKNLLIDLNGSTITSKRKLPLIYHYTNMGITAPGDTGPYTVPGWTPKTTVAVASDGVTLPTATINVASTTGFASSGSIAVATGGGAFTIITHRGVTGTSFTSCTGGVGILATGQAVTNTNQAIYVDPTSTQNLGAQNNAGVGDDTNINPDQDDIPPLTFLRNPVRSAVVTATGATKGYAIGQIASKTFAPCTPATGIPVIFLGPNGALARFSLVTDANGVRCQNIKIRNGTLAGTNDGLHPPPGQTGHLPAGSYDQQVEGQHGIDAKGVDGLELGPNLLIQYVWGDGVNTTVDSPAGSGTHLDPRPTGTPGGNACRNVYMHDVEIHHNGRQGVTATGDINFLMERCNLHDNPRSGIDTEIPTNSCVLNMTIRWNGIFPSFSWVNPASYPVGSNVYFENLTLDSNITHGLALNANNTLSNGTLRWKNFTIINNDASSASAPFGRSVPNNVTQFINCDNLTVTGNTQKMTGVIWFVEIGNTCSQVSVHDNTLIDGPPWVTATHYTQGGGGIGPSCVTNGTNAYFCTQSHTSNAATEPGVGSLWFNFWRSLQVHGTALPLLFPNFTSGSLLTATVANASAPPRVLGAALASGSTLTATVTTTSFLQAHTFSASVLTATVVATRPPTFLTGTFTSGSRLVARIQRVRRTSGFGKNEFRSGSVAARGPGWDAEPNGWDSEPWGGLG
jgi:hypothetical protein